MARGYILMLLMVAVLSFVFTHLVETKQDERTNYVLRPAMRLPRTQCSKNLLLCLQRLEVSMNHLIKSLPRIHVGIRIGNISFNTRFQIQSTALTLLPYKDI